MWQMWQVIQAAENDHGTQCLPTEVNPFWLWKRFQWWISSRSPEGTLQTSTSSLSPLDCVSIPCRSSDRRGLRWCWSHNIRPGTPVEQHPSIFQTTTVRWLRVHRGDGSVRPGLRSSCLCPCQALHPRLASQDLFNFRWRSPSLLLRLSGKRHWRFTSDVSQKASRNHQ